MATAVAATAPLPSPPEIRFRTPFAFIDRMRADPIRLFSDALYEHGDIVRFRMPLANGYLLAHPDHVAHVLEDNRENYWKGRVFSRLIPYVGEGLLLSEGELWQKQRRLCQPAFRRSRLVALERVMTDRTEALLERWKEIGADTEPVEITGEMSRLALDIVTRALFGSKGIDNFEEFGEAMNEAVELSNWMFNRLLPPQRWLPTPRMRRSRRSMRVQDRTVQGLIADQRAATGERQDLLSALLAARDDDTHEGMTDEQLRAELVIFISAGHETTAMALTWTWYLLAIHPEIEARLHAELDAVLGGRVPTADDVQQLGFTRHVIQESMRLLPPAWAIPRESRGPDEIGGYRIDKRSSIFIVPYLTHRHPEFWERPEVFDPDRFDPVRSQGRHRLAYMPFGAGPRACIGIAFAMLEMQLALATLAQRVRLELAPGPPVVPDPIFTLRPKNGVRMWVRPR